MQKRERITWEQFHQDVLSMVPHLKTLDIDSILAIGLGGFCPAMILAHHLHPDPDQHLPVEVVMAEHYQEPGVRQSEVVIKSITRRDFVHVLVIDEVYETGRTMDAVQAMLQAQRIEVAAVYNKARDYRPYYHFGRVLDPEVWYVFPWERSS